MKKYEFTGETKQVGLFGNITLKRNSGNNGIWNY